MHEIHVYVQKCCLVLNETHLCLGTVVRVTCRSVTLGHGCTISLFPQGNQFQCGYSHSECRCSVIKTENNFYMKLTEDVRILPHVVMKKT